MVVPSRRDDRAALCSCSHLRVQALNRLDLAISSHETTPAEWATLRDALENARWIGGIL
jgi:hypothetical protein